MSRWSYVIRSLWHYRRTHFAVATAVAIATAVLTGALLVGDSVRGSLRAISLERLGSIDQVLVTGRYFSLDRVDELASRSSRRTAPAIVIPQTTIERLVDGAMEKRMRAVTLLGVDERFWEFDLQPVPADALPAIDEIVLNFALAEQLGAKVGDQITVRLPDASQVPADSALGKKEGRISSLANLRVSAILPSRGLATFSLYPSQAAARNAFVSMVTIQDAIDRPDQINAIVRGALPDGQAASAVDDELRLVSSDFGIKLERHTQVFSAEDADPESTASPEVIWDYWQLTSDRLMWPDAAREAALDALPSESAQETLTYLVNDIELVTFGSATSDDNRANEGVSRIPYSTVTALDNHPTLGPVVDDEDHPMLPLTSGEIALNSWSADRLAAKLGDTVRLRYFLPETTHGEAEETFADFTVAAITPLTEPATPFRRRRPATFDVRPTRANDPDLTPTVEGVTDQDSIDDWDPPFPFDNSRIEDADDRYWEYHRTTPKAFISLADGKRLWRSRFGQSTSFRLPASEAIDEVALTSAMTRELSARQESLGFEFQPIRENSLAASSGTTPFQWLFVGFSFFLIASAMMLIAVLFRLGMELRAREMGELRAFGWRVPLIRRVTLGEASLVSVAGATVGVLGGIAYAWLMIAGLRTIWVAAIATPFLTLYCTPASLVAGWIVGIVVALAVVWFSLRWLSRVSPSRLLAGSLPTRDIDEASQVASASGIVKRSARSGWFAVGLGLASIGSAVAATFLSGEAQAGAFFGAGAFALSSAMVAMIRWLSAAATDLPSSTRFGPANLAWRTAARNPSRSALTMGLMAAATFLIAAIAAFQLPTTESGTGGFQLLAETDRPLHLDFFDEEDVTESFGQDKSTLAEVDILAMRIHDGEDASCRNLFQSRQPRVIGISQQMIDYFDEHDDRFAWSGYDADRVASEHRSNRWRVLMPHTTPEVSGSEVRQEFRHSPSTSKASTTSATTSPAAIPVILDKNTAMYSLHLPAKIGHEFEMGYDRPLRFRIVGLTSNTILQGNLLMHEDDLVRAFPETAGYRQFLIRNKVDSPRGPQTSDLASVTRLLERRFGDEGMVVESTIDRLRDLLAVQNTYLSTFQSLGALGLLLGVCGLAAVQVRNIMARQSELALLSAIGFSRAALRRQLVMENAVLLVSGLGIGLTSALVAVVPHWLVGDAQFPLATVFVMLSVIGIVGLFAGVVTARWAGQQSLVHALRNG